MKKNQLEIYTENNIKKKGHQDWGSSSEEENPNQNIGQDLERLDRKTIVMKLGKYKYAKGQTKMVHENKNNTINIDKTDDVNKNEIVMGNSEDIERIKTFYCLMYLSNFLLVIELLWS